MSYSYIQKVFPEWKSNEDREFKALLKLPLNEFSNRPHQLSPTQLSLNQLSPNQLSPSSQNNISILENMTNIANDLFAQVESPIPPKEQPKEQLKEPLINTNIALNSFKKNATVSYIPVPFNSKTIKPESLEKIENTQTDILSNCQKYIDDILNNDFCKDYLLKKLKLEMSNNTVFFNEKFKNNLIELFSLLLFGILTIYLIDRMKK
jgi:hypothetical protein